MQLNPLLPGRSGASSGFRKWCVPFKADGELPAGATAKLKVTASEVAGKGTQLQVLVECVRIRG